jgi:hypothetical protein
MKGGSDEANRTKTHVKEWELFPPAAGTSRADSAERVRRREIHVVDFGVWFSRVPPAPLPCGLPHDSRRQPVGRGKALARDASGTRERDAASTGLRVDFPLDTRREISKILHGQLPTTRWQDGVMGSVLAEVLRQGSRSPQARPAATMARFRARRPTKHG